jgi:REP element-mobilizing transposase RayT
MPRPLRFQPEEWMTHFVTTRCIHSRMLLRPSQSANRLIIGVFARAAQRYNVRTFGLCVLSNHYHLLISSPNASTLSSFMQYVNSNIAREIGRLHGWKEKFWSRRYRASLVLDDAAHIDRLKYIFSNSFKEGLVKHARYWPGVHCHSALVEKRALVGVWIDRAQGHLSGHDDAEELTLEFHQLPCLSELGDAAYRDRMQELSREAHQECETPIEFLGQKRILAVDPHTKPKKTSRSPAPLCHAGCQMLSRAFRLVYQTFIQVYKQTFEAFRDRLQQALFPRGGLPPVAWFTKAASSG